MRREKGHFVLFYDKIFTHDFFKEEKFTEREMWLWMISKAAFSDYTSIFSGREISLKRGQLVASCRVVMSVSGWSQQRWQGYMRRLSENGMITTVQKNGITLITLENFDKFQRKNEKTDTVNTTPTTTPITTATDTPTDTQNNKRITTTTPAYVRDTRAREAEKPFKISENWSPCADVGRRILAQYEKAGINEQMARDQKVAFIAHYRSKGEENTNAGWEERLKYWVLSDCRKPNKVKAKYEDVAESKKLPPENFHSLCF